MSVSEPWRLRLAGAGAVLIALALCGVPLSSAARGARTAPAPPPQPDLEEVPEPRLDGVAEPIRQGIERVRRAIEAERRSEPAPARLAAAYGLLGALYHAHGYPAPALAAYANARRLAPDDRRWVYYSGLLHASEGRESAAIEAFRAALDRREDVPTLLRLADLRLAIGSLDEARRLFERVLELDPDSAAAHFGLGRVATSRREWEQAIRAYERALELQPDATSLHYPLGQAYRASGRLEEAERHLALRGARGVTFSDPLEDQLGDIQTLSAARVLFDLAGDGEGVSDLDYLGFALNHFGGMEGAAEAIEKMLAAATKSGEASPQQLARLHLAVAGLWERRGAHPRAVEHLRSAVRLDGELLEAHLELAHVLARQQEFAQAIESYDRVLTLDDAHPAALLGRATAATALGRDGEARRDLERLLADPDEHAAAGHLVLAGIHERAGDGDGAERHFRSVLELAPAARQEAEAETGLARLLRARGELAAATEHFERAAALLDEGPRLEAVLLDLGAALAALERYGDAAGVYRRLVEQEPRSEAAQLGLASALILAGRYAEAGDRLRTAHGVLPESAALRHLLARLLAAAPQTDLRDGSLALELAEELFAERRDAARAETLAMALAQAGRFGEAVRLQGSLVEAARRAAAERSARRLEADLERYTSGQTCCARQDWTVLLPPREPAVEPRAQ